jgi:hypothetical protein
MTAPWSRSIGYRYDGYLQLDTLVDLDGGSTRILYNNERMPSVISLPTGLYSTMTYPSTHQTATVTYSDSTVDALLGLGFAFDSVRLVAQRQNPGGDTLNTYLYDADGRLTWFSKYHYDVGPTCGDDPHDGWECGPPPDPTETLLVRRVYEYDLLGNPDTVWTYDGEGWTYADAQSDTANRLVAFGTFSMEYDDAGNLTRKYMADTTQFNQ